MSELNKENDKDKRIKELEERIKKLEAERERKTKSEKEKGIADSVLEELSSTIPGLGGLIKGVEKSELFNKKLKEVEKEIINKFKDTPLKKTSQKGMPPSWHGDKKEAGFAIKKEALRDIIVDIFDEKTCLEIIAELPGVDENDIKMELMDNMLTIETNAVKPKYFKKIQLPCNAKGIIKKSYKNGILEITLEKETS